MSFAAALDQFWNNHRTSVNISKLKPNVSTTIQLSSSVAHTKTHGDLLIIIAKNGRLIKVCVMG